MVFLYKGSLINILAFTEAPIGKRLASFKELLSLTANFKSGGCLIPGLYIIENKSIPARMNFMRRESMMIKNIF